MQGLKADAEAAKERTAQLTADKERLLNMVSRLELEKRRAEQDAMTPSRGGVSGTPGTSNSASGPASSGCAPVNCCICSLPENTQRK